MVEEDGECFLGAVVQAEQARPEELLHHLKTRLPRAWLPSRIRFTDVMPLNANRKIDHEGVRVLLLAREPSERGLALASGDSGPVRDAVATIWARLLPGISAVAPNTNFFLSGGNSLLAALSLQQLEDVLGVRVTLEEMFTNPTYSVFSDLVAAKADSTMTGPCHEVRCCARS